LKPLIVFSNAFDCIPSIDALKVLPCDQLHINYFPYPENYEIGQKFFLDHPEYTHYIFHSPDIVIPRFAFEFMLEQIKYFDYDVYGPAFNMDMQKHKDRILCTPNLPDLDYGSRRYYWISEGRRQQLIKSGNGIIHPKFNGLGFTWVKRWLVDTIPFTTLPYETDERPIWETRGGYACDLAFSHWLNYLDVKINYDLRIKCEHLRYWGQLQVGLKEPQVNLIKYENNDKGEIWQVEQLKKQDLEKPLKLAKEKK